MIEPFKKSDQISSEKVQLHPDYERNKENVGQFLKKESNQLNGHVRASDNCMTFRAARGVMALDYNMDSLNFNKIFKLGFEECWRYCQKQCLNDSGSI